MNEGKIPVRYAKALFESAVHKNLIDNISEDMQLIGETCRQEDIRELLRSPIIPASEKKKIFHNIFENKINPLTLSLIDLMIKNGREAFLPSVARIFNATTLRYHGVTEPELTTAVPVSDTVRRQITDYISAKFSTKVRLKENVDPEIIGGFILKVDDYFIDASIRTKLRKIKKSLTDNVNNQKTK